MTDQPTRKPARMDLVFPQSEMTEFYLAKYGPVDQQGERPQRRYKFKYYQPDDLYEALMNRMVTPGCRWLDVGGGRNVFPSNVRLAEKLAQRAGRLVGVDPSANIHENKFVHEGHQAFIEDFESNEPFDLISLRMVAEHITKPEAAVASIARLLKPGGKAIIYTINLWSPLSVAAWVVPFNWHHPIKKFFWKTEEKDSFPVAYRMNTQRTLRKQMAKGGMTEVGFRRLDDLNTFSQFRFLNYCELLSWKCLHTLGLPYPEHCLLGVYEKTVL